MSELLTMTPEQFCDATNACSDGREYALTQPTMADVWDNCPRADWLLWIVKRLDQKPDDRTPRLFAIWCVRNLTLLDGRKIDDLLNDPRSLAALEVTERYADGKATADELAAARDAAWAAVRAATGAFAEAAAWAAAGAAADAADAAWAGARADARAAQADHLRTLVPNPFRKEPKP